MTWTKATAGNPYAVPAAPALTNVAIGNLVLLIINCQSATVWVTGITGGGCTWSLLGVKFLGSSTPWTTTAWAGTVTATGAATPTFTYNGTTPTTRGSGLEFHSTVGSWALDVQAGIDSRTNYPPLTAAAAGELYYGFHYDSATAVAGATSGFTYFVDANSNGACWNLNSGSGTVTPAWGDTTIQSGMVLLVTETGGAPASILPQQAKHRFPAVYTRINAPVRRSVYSR